MSGRTGGRTYGRATGGPGDVGSTPAADAGRTRLGRAGRFLVPLGDERVTDWFLRDLYVPHSRGERWATAGAALLAGTPLRRAARRLARKAVFTAAGTVSANGAVPGLGDVSANEAGDEALARPERVAAGLPAAARSGWSEALDGATWLLAGDGRPLLAEAGLADGAPGDGNLSWVLARDHATKDFGTTDPAARNPAASDPAAGPPETSPPETNAPGISAPGTSAPAASSEVSRRRRAVLFLFARHHSGQNRPHPDAVVKLRPLAAGGAPLAAEHRHLQDLRESLPDRLAATLPVPLAWRRDAAAGWEATAVSGLPGHSMGAELATVPLPARVVERHFDAALSWLLEFQAATRGDESFQPPPWSDLGDGAAPSWYTELRARLERRPLPAVAVHGDYWPRNLLVGAGGLSGVVDWEHARLAGGPHLDLFQFPLAYGRAYRWRGGPPAAEEACRRTFLEPTVVCRATARYLDRYAAASGLDPELLGLLLRLDLVSRAAGGPQPHDREGGEPWRTCEQMLAATGRYASSG